MSAELNLKIGDKIRVVKFPDKSIIGKIGIVIELCHNSQFSCRVKDVLVPTWGCLMRADEIEKLPRKNEQLMLFELF